MTWCTGAAYSRKSSRDAHLCDNGDMDNWDEIRSAAEVARLGTVSAAASSLGVHRATINRHVDSLEHVFGSSLFQRHARGYSPTELGIELLRVADATEEQLSQLLRRAQSYATGLSGELVITSVAGVTSTFLPAINAFCAEHPQVRVRYICSDTLLKLEYGEAHIAFRVGPKPKDPDNIVRPYRTISMGLYATAAYAEQHGIPKSSAEYKDHYFVGSDSEVPRAPFLLWMRENVPRECIRFTSNEGSVLKQIILDGNGIGFLSAMTAAEHTGLIEVCRPEPNWSVPIWIVTHVDLHRSAKVQGLLKHLTSPT